MSADKSTAISSVALPIAPSKFVSPESIDLIKFYRRRTYKLKHFRNKNKEKSLNDYNMKFLKALCKYKM